MHGRAEGGGSAVIQAPGQAPWGALELDGPPELSLAGLCVLHWTVPIAHTGSKCGPRSAGPSALGLAGEANS